MNKIEEALAAIKAQQEKMELNSPAYFVGEQLAQIMRTTPGAAELVIEDLKVESMALKECEKKIAAAARKNKKGNVGFVGPEQADKIIRRFYGLPSAAPSVDEAQEVQPVKTQQVKRRRISLTEFL